MEDTPAEIIGNWQIYFIGTGERETFEGSADDAVLFATKDGRQLEGKRGGVVIFQSEDEPSTVRNWLIYFLGSKEIETAEGTLEYAISQATIGGRHLSGKRMGVSVVPIAGPPPAQEGDDCDRLMERALILIRKARAMRVRGGHSDSEISEAVSGAISKLQNAKQRILLNEPMRRAHLASILDASGLPMATPPPQPTKSPRARQGEAACAVAFYAAPSAPLRLNGASHPHA
jgi:hypothetical protein